MHTKEMHMSGLARCRSDRLYKTHGQKGTAPWGGTQVVLHCCDEGAPVLTVVGLVFMDTGPNYSAPH